MWEQHRKTPVKMTALGKLWYMVTLLKTRLLDQSWEWTWDFHYDCSMNLNEPVPKDTAFSVIEAETTPYPELLEQFPPFLLLPVIAQANVVFRMTLGPGNSAVLKVIVYLLCLIWVNLFSEERKWSSGQSCQSVKHGFLWGEGMGIQREEKCTLLFVIFCTIWIFLYSFDFLMIVFFKKSSYSFKILTDYAIVQWRPLLETHKFPRRADMLDFLNIIGLTQDHTREKIHIL